MAEEIERVTKRGQRYYKKPKREKPPIVNLIPVAFDVAKAIFNTNGDAPSVTTILGTLAKPALISWAAKEERKMISALAGNLYERLYQIVDEPVTPEKFMELLESEAGKGAHRKLLEKAANVGTQVHARIEWNFKGELGIKRAEEPPELTSLQAQRAFKRWEEWRDSVKLKVIAIEKRLFSQLFGYGGTLDFLGEIDVDGAKLMVVGDFKTGKHIYAEAYLQNVAYRMALAEEGIHTDKGIIIRLPKYEDDPEFDAQEVPEDPSYEITFLALNVVYKLFYGKEHKKNESK